MDISDATSSTYTLAEADIGKKIKVKVSFTDDSGSAETLTSAAYPSETNTIANVPNTAATGGPEISGTAQVGQTLTATEGDIADENGLPATFPDDYTFQWVLVDGVTESDISGATASTYTLVETDQGKAVRGDGKLHRPQRLRRVAPKRTDIGGPGASQSVYHRRHVVREGDRRKQRKTHQRLPHGVLQQPPAEVSR